MPDHHPPRKVWLAPSVCYTVKYVSPNFIEGAFGKKGKAGFTDTEARIIYIDKTLSFVRKWSVVRHELIHAIIDTDTEIGGGL